MGVKPYTTRYLSISRYPTEEGHVLKAPEVEEELERMLMAGWQLVSIVQVPPSPNAPTAGREAKYLAVFRRLGDGS